MSLIIYIRTITRRCGHHCADTHGDAEGGVTTSDVRAVAWSGCAVDIHVRRNIVRFRRVRPVRVRTQRIVPLVDMNVSDNSQVNAVCVGNVIDGAEVCPRLHVKTFVPEQHYPRNLVSVLVRLRQIILLHILSPPRNNHGPLVALFDTQM